ncbi:MAG: DNA-directed RNA polymerase subunit omega [Holosporaceae bacterium]|jgi:DNA-directed RNA polymerase subunit omega|nr:DNA-directed RNA polymerase subunit omega [Holosporaceae bacterium]
MARITVEDCEKIVENRFELVILAAQRARQIFAGDKVTIEKKDEKKPIIALREIAARTVLTDKLKEKAIERFRSFTFEEEYDENLEELMENDAYSPYIGMEVQALESDNVSIVDESELDAGELDAGELDASDLDASDLDVSDLDANVIGV